MTPETWARAKAGAYGCDRPPMPPHGDTLSPRERGRLMVRRGLLNARLMELQKEVVCINRASVDERVEEFLRWRQVESPLRAELNEVRHDLKLDYLRKIGPPEALQKYQYRLAFSATRYVLRRVVYAVRAGPNGRQFVAIDMKALRNTVDKDEIGINTLLQESYGIFRDVTAGRVTPQVASAAARNCGNVLKGLELRAKFGVEALRF